MTIPTPRPLPEPGGSARRAATVLAVLSRHGLSPLGAPAEGSPSPGRSPLGVAGRRLAAAFEALGPTFIKLGQLIASSPGVFPERLGRELRRCRDRVAPMTADRVRSVIADALGRPAAEVFASFDPSPLASASIAQVHAARLASGRDVVVKVKRPGIEQVVATDLRVIERSLGLLQVLLPRSAAMSAADVAAEFRRTITEEMDFRVEAAYQRRMGEILSVCGDGEVIVPGLIDELCNADVLVMERLDAFPFDDADEVARSGLDPVSLLHHATRTVQETAIVHGMFHGDLHSANLLVMRDGRLAYVDFGIMGTLDPDAALAVGRFFAGMLFEDYEFVVDSLLRLGALPSGVDRDRLAGQLRRGGSRIMGGGLTGRELAPMIWLGLRLAAGHRARLPRSVVLLSKQLLYLDGAARALAPEANLMGEAVEILLYFSTRYPDLTDRLLPPDVLEELRAGGPDAVRARRVGAT